MPPVLWLLVRPRSPRIFLLLCILHTISWWIRTPEVGNHTLFMAFIHLFFLLTAARQIWRSSFDPEKLLEEVAPAIRISLLLVYAFTFFHKLNSGFFNSQDSCAVYFYTVLSHSSLGTLLPSLHGQAAPFVICSVLGGEAAVFILLLIRRTRPYGILLGLFLHLFLGFTHYTFSLMAYALYLLFLDRDFFTEFPLKTFFSRRPVIPCLGFGCLAVFLLFFFQKPPFVSDAWDSPLLRYRPYAWLFLNSLLIGGYAWALFSRRAHGGGRNRFFYISWWPLFLLPMLVFANGLCPYLGLKTGGSFTMYSNLVIEAGSSNHLVLPKGLIQVVNFPDDVVILKDTNRVKLFRRLAEKIPTPWIELKRVIQQMVREGDSGIRLSYLRDGKFVSLTSAESDPELSQPLPWYVRKFVIFPENLQLSPVSREKCSW